MDTYFLRVAGIDAAWQEVTQEQFVKAERAAGFHPKPGGGPVATHGFSNGAIEGRVSAHQSSQKGRSDEGISSRL